MTKNIDPTKRDRPNRFGWDGDPKSLRLPDGLSFKDAQRAACLVAEWQDSEAFSPIPLVIEIYSLLHPYAVQKGRKKSA